MLTFSVSFNTWICLSSHITDQIDQLTPGSSVILRNCVSSLFEGHLLLSMDRWGLIEPHATMKLERSMLNIDVRLSDDEFELVSKGGV